MDLILHAGCISFCKQESISKGLADFYNSIAFETRLASRQISTDSAVAYQTG